MITNLVLIGLGISIIIPLWILIDKKKNENLSKEILNDFAVNFVQYLREKDVVSISQKQINLLTSGKSIKSFSEHLIDFNNRHNEKSKELQK
jgi:hypothetical protein